MTNSHKPDTRTSKDYHRTAMELVDDARDAQRNGNPAIALTLFKEAETLERKAAGMVTRELAKGVLTNSANEIAKTIEQLERMAQ